MVLKPRRAPDGRWMCTENSPTPVGHHLTSHRGSVISGKQHLILVSSNSSISKSVLTSSSSSSDSIASPISHLRSLSSAMSIRFGRSGTSPSFCPLYTGGPFPVPTSHLSSSKLTLPPPLTGNGYTSSQVMETADDDWRTVTDLSERRKIQNRLAQRNYRRKLRQRLEELERQAGETTSSVFTPSTITKPKSPPTPKSPSTTPPTKKSKPAPKQKSSTVSGRITKSNKPATIRIRSNSTNTYNNHRAHLTPPMSAGDCPSSLTSPCYPTFPSQHQSYYPSTYTPTFHKTSPSPPITHGNWEPTPEPQPRYNTQPAYSLPSTYIPTTAPTTGHPSPLLTPEQVYTLPVTTSTASYSSPSPPIKHEIDPWGANTTTIPEFIQTLAYPVSTGEEEVVGLGVGLGMGGLSYQHGRSNSWPMTLPTTIGLEEEFEAVVAAAGWSFQPQQDILWE